MTAIVNESLSIIVIAGKSFVPDSWNKPLDFFKTNTSGTTNVADAARISGAKIVFSVPLSMVNHIVYR
ncbi:MAG: NAD-dependent epimerase/dehydratase family protein [Crocinitomicaceae bacterium]|nr:NAD-dependent epimerase/dehydratase family protein [Crocinitomicaceae bacterium]